MAPTSDDDMPLANIKKESAHDDPHGNGAARRRPVHARVVDAPPPGGQRKTVKRELRGIQILMITINATLGIGLYWRGGQILEIGGPLAVVLSFLLGGLLAYAVMQCVTEMMSIWPVPGALYVYVREFVDVDLGIAAGIAYWFAYSVGFAALVAASAAELELWLGGRGADKPVDGVVVYTIVPLAMICINLVKVKWYGYFEVVIGTVKLVFLCAIIIGVGTKRNPEATEYNWKNGTITHEYDHSVANGWAASFLMSISVAIFAYMGVEVVAVSALEARPSKRHNQQPGQISNTVKRSASWVAPVASLLYTISSLLATFAIKYDDCRLPRLNWATDLCGSSGPRGSQSVFVSVARDSSTSLSNAFNVFMVITALSCANTNLYVASRTLFGLTRALDPDESDLPLRILAYFSRTSKHFKVPYRAVIFSAVAFGWVPYLQLGPQTSKSGISSNSNIGQFIDTLSNMASTAIIIVWACVCLAYIRFYFYLKQHRDALEADGRYELVRDDRNGNDKTSYPYRSHAQPFTATMAFLGCAFILLGTSAAAFTTDFFPYTIFLSSYFVVIIFLAMWIALKIFRGNIKIWGVDLRYEETFKNKVRRLNDMRLAATPAET